MDPTEPITFVTSTSATTAVPSVPLSSFGIDISVLFTGLFSGGSVPNGLVSFLGSFWSFYTVLAYIVCIIFLILYVYAAVQKNLYYDLRTERLRAQEKLYDEQIRGNGTNSRLADIFTHSESDNPNDWKLAIIEADIILDSVLKNRGYAGDSLGERLRSISPSQLGSLNDAWEAHKVRNRIAHDGADYVLTKRMTEETIARYRRVFAEFGVT
ncbi:hypothetical protein KC865_02755 [Candidatus Kaiserbacteria bacterium]|nr:hypothetical protein [Candidatus Kaiserbacteria bacterium]USN92325.1 MAG: hypothetical protein H6782_00720 [Candidatus Nomurabacteria bacterium]